MTSLGILGPLRCNGRGKRHGAQVVDAADSYCEPNRRYQLSRGIGLICNCADEPVSSVLHTFNHKRVFGHASGMLHAVEAAIGRNTKSVGTPLKTALVLPVGQMQTAAPPHVSESGPVTWAVHQPLPGSKDRIGKLGLA